MINQLSSDSVRFYDHETETELDAVRQIIIDNVSSPYPQISEPLVRLVNAKSKMLRPAFLVLSSGFGNPEKEKIRQLAAAIEMLHTATLIHDDIVDKAATRRGQASLHILSGSARSVLMGDYLISRGIRLILKKISESNFEMLTAVVSHLCESEIAESASSFSTDVTVRQYLRRIAGKTASLFALSCHTGASESGCSTQEASALRRCGYCTGMAFQIIDDILDLKGSGSKLGKPCANDLREGTFTLPVIYTLQADAGEFRKKLLKLKSPCALNREHKISVLVRMMEKSGGIKIASDMAGKYTDRALDELKKLKPGKARDKISALVSALLEREY